MTKLAPISVLGATGWIGSALVADLKASGREVVSIDRHNLNQWLVNCHNDESVIYAIGLTSDFRVKPHETVEAHVGILSKVLQLEGIKQLLFLSSTRVYGRSATTDESVPVNCLSAHPSDFYNISKLMGEALVLQDTRPGMKVVRLSNVVGPLQPQNTFLGELINESKKTGKVIIRQSRCTEKDYVGLCDVVKLLPNIADFGSQRIYNVGSGLNTTHASVGKWLESHGFEVEFGSCLDHHFEFPPLNINRLLKEFPRPGNPFNQNLLG